MLNMPEGLRLFYHGPQKKGPESSVKAADCITILFFCDKDILWGR